MLLPVIVYAFLMNDLISENQNKILVQELIQIYSLKKAQNSSFSLRAFGKKIGVSSGALTEILQGKRRVTRATAVRILENLNFSGEEIKMFVDGKVKKSARTYADLSLDHYEIIATWQYLSLLNFLELPNETHSTKNISKRMGLTLKKTEDLLKRLLRLGMIEKKEDRFYRTFLRYQTSEDIVNAAIKKYHRQTLELSEKALDKVAVDERDFSSIILKVHPKNLSRIKKKIRDFQDELSEEMDNDDPREIYHLNVHLYPVTKRGSDV